MRRAAARPVALAITIPLIFAVTLWSGSIGEDLKLKRPARRSLEADDDGACSFAGLNAAQDQCAYVQEFCSDLASLVDYLSLLYCYGRTNGDSAVAGPGAGVVHRGAQPWVTAALALWLVLLISLLGTTADYFFVPALEYLSFDMLKLSPEIAGITLLALVSMLDPRRDRALRFFAGRTRHKLVFTV